MNFGQGSIGKSGPGGAPSGFINVAGARNGLEMDAMAFVVLGQDPDQAGDPAKLLSDRRIPFNGFGLSFLDLLPAAPVTQEVTFFEDAPIDIRAGSGDTTGSGGYFQFFTPQNYLESYVSVYPPAGSTTMDRWSIGYILGDNGEVPGVGMPDAVINFGYNMSTSGGRLNATDGAWRLGFETNFLGSIDGVMLDFEFHLPEVISFTGVTSRLNSYYVNKENLFTFNQRFVDQTEWNSNVNGLLYANLLAGNVANECTFQMFGTGVTTVSGHLQMFDNTTGNNAGFRYGSDMMRFANNDVDQHGWDQTGNFFSVQGNIPATAHLIGIKGGSGFNTPDVSAILQCWSTTQGFAPPAMTTVQRLAIAVTTLPLLVFDTTLAKLALWTGAAWQIVTSV